MTTLSIELTPAEQARLIATASAQGITPETLVHRLVIESLPESINVDRDSSLAKTSANTAREASVSETHDAQLVNEGGVLVLAHLGVDVNDWDSVVERERETRIDTLCHAHPQ